MLEPTLPWPLPDISSPQSGFQTPLRDREDDASSDDSIDDAVITASSKSFNAAGEWIVERAPAFLCGIVVAWISLLILWRTDGEALHAENESARVLIGELRHMIEALRAEGAEARRLLAAASEMKSGSIGADFARAAAAQVSHSSDISYYSASASDASSSRTMQADVPSHFELFFRTLAPLVLFLVDGGLVYFCLRQCASQVTKNYLESLLLLMLEKFGVDAWIRDPHVKPPADAAAGFQRSRPNVDDRTESAVKRAEPVAADAFLVRRRDGSDMAPMQREQLRRQAEQLQNLRQRRSIASLTATSVIIVAAMRLVVWSADAVGWRFLNHLVMYAVLTVRVCLIVLLVLF